MNSFWFDLPGIEPESNVLVDDAAIVRFLWHIDVAELGIGKLFLFLVSLLFFSSLFLYCMCIDAYA